MEQNAALFKKVRELNEYMIYQSEIEEIQLLTFGEGHLASGAGEVLAKTYGSESPEDTLHFIRQNGKIFYDLEAWSNFVRSTQGVIGTRLHGAILALNSGVSGVLIPHDSRTSELAEFAKIPSLSPEQAIKLEGHADFLSALKNDQRANFYETRTLNSRIYRGFLAGCGLPANEASLH